MAHDIAQLQVNIIPQEFESRKSIQQFQRYAFQLRDKPIWVKWVTMAKPIQAKWANDDDVAQLQMEKIP